MTTTELRLTTVMYHYVRDVWYVPAYEPDLAKFGLGNIELFNFLRHSYANGAAEADLGSAEFTDKKRGTNGEATRRSVTIAAPGRRAQSRPRTFHLAVSYRVPTFTRGEQHSHEPN